MNSEALEISIIMPCLNEELTIGHCINKALSWMRENSVAGEVVIGDNGSTDRSREIAADLGTNDGASLSGAGTDRRDKV